MKYVKYTTQKKADVTAPEHSLKVWWFETLLTVFISPEYLARNL